jgi:hypothetical protein
LIEEKEEGLRCIEHKQETTGHERKHLTPLNEDEKSELAWLHCHMKRKNSRNQKEKGKGRANLRD